MKNKLFLCGATLLTLAAPAGAAVVIDQDWTVNTPVPEGSFVGITTYQTFSGLASGAITDVSVDLNLTGGYNGALVGYLVLQDANGNTATEFLLNEIGTSPSNLFGSAGAGMNVTLSDSGTVNGSIHNAAGVPTGVWQPDSASTLDGTFGGMTANGTWTLYLADEDGGTGTSVLQSWGLDVSVTSVPEASETGWAAGLGGLLAVGGAALIQRRKLKTQ